jgi:hypothetical protein
MNSHCPVGLVSRQWDAIDWALYCVTVAFTNLLPFNRDFSFGKSQKSQGARLYGQSDLGDVKKWQKSMQESCRMGRCIVLMKLICSLGHCEYNGHTVHKLSQWHLTADWLAPWESDFYGCRVRSPLTSCHILSRPHNRFLRYSKWLDTFWTALVNSHIHLTYSKTIKCDTLCHIRLFLCFSNDDSAVHDTD